ncbi:MAG TPA: PilZ domain-containing protein [Chromobacteriaceae bacterium]|nr:PilZ domain-containing protein [Chromobacteriaceae bacterium]
MFDFKSLVSSLLTKNTSASDVAQSATLLVQDLPQTEYFTALIEIIKAVSKINADTDMSLKERFKTLLYVDEKSHSIHRELCQDYLQQKPGSKSYLPTILAYWNELTTAYQLCLKLHQSTPNGIPEPQLRLITARGLHHQMRLIAWNALRYLKPEGSSWLQAYRFYSQAEESGIARTPIALYPDSSTEQSCEQLLLQGCMLHLAQTENMLHKEIQAVDQLLLLLCQGARLEKQPPIEDPVFVINLTQAEQPQLMLRGMASPNHRYWSASPMTGLLADLMFELDKRVPSALKSLKCELDRKEWSCLCEKLAVRWTSDRGKSQRKSERSLHSSTAWVSIGFERAAFQTKVQSLNDTDNTQQEEWRITDISGTGMGLSYVGKPNEPLAIGKVILVKTESHPLVLGIVRRIELQQTSSRVGIEILGQNPVGVTLLDPSETDGHPATAIYITQPNSRQGQRWFLMQKNWAVPEKELILTAQGKSYKIRLKAPQQLFEDCGHSDFETVAKVD